MKNPLKKILTVTLSVATVLSALPAIPALSLQSTTETSTVYASNFLPEKASVFDTAQSVEDTFWTKKYGSPTVTLSDDGAPNKSLKFTTPNSYSSPAINLADYITYAGTYNISFDYKVKSTVDTVPFTVLIRSDKVYSFTKQVGSNIYGEIGKAQLGANDVWYTFSSSVTVTEDDLANKSEWNLCVHNINSSVSEIYIDNVIVANDYSDNLIPDISSDFDTATSPANAGWGGIVGSPTSAIVDGDDGKCLYFTPNGVNYNSPACNIAPYITSAGRYYISFEYKVDSSSTVVPFAAVIRGDKVYSFTNTSGYKGMKNAQSSETGQWYTYTDSFTVTEEDIADKVTWNLCLHTINSNVTGIYLDNVTVKKYDPESTLDKPVTRATVWMKNEAVFLSTKAYANAYNDVTLDLILTNGTVTYKIPAFWDGGNVWRARFVCPTVGNWTYTTECSDTENSSLHGRTGSLICSAYSGDKAIYQHGFVKTDTDKRYFTYSDGTPFFYLGDTHWGLGSETVDMVETIAQKRAAQGFTVMQSEPIGAKFNLTDGITENDMAGFEDFDAKFEIIASYGLVHANAEFFYPSSMRSFIVNHGGWLDTPVGDDESICELSQSAEDALERLTRYWVARYSAYPVMWTLGQEVDDDFYWEREGNNSHSEWNGVNNPYLFVAEMIGEYDPYSHPLSAHQENTGATTASTSVFRDCEEHSWYAAQWSQNYNTAQNFTAPKDYWNNGQNKPTVLYEGKYCYLWTKDFGARVQGWMAYLNGMYGASWGGQDTWCYTNSYNEDSNSSDGVDIITSEDKTYATWQDTLTYKSTYQLGYMREFFEKHVGNWYDLVPRFDSADYFVPADSNVFYVCASDSVGDKAVVYFYNFSESDLAEKPNSTAENAVKTGTLGGLIANSQYSYIWYDPVNGQIYSSGTVTSDGDGKITVPQKNTRDAVFYACKKDTECLHTDKVSFSATSSTCENYGHGAYEFCYDCNSVVSGSCTVTPLASHTYGNPATCTENQVCSVCSVVLNKRLGHSYDSTATQPTCTEKGNITYTCKACGHSYNKEVDALGHADCETVKIQVSGQNYIVSKSNCEITPFKMLSFSGDSCKVKLYVFNNTDKNLTGVYLAYDWGWFAYNQGDYTTRIPGTYVSTNLAPNSGRVIELTVPRECILSNKSGSASDGANDSLGEKVSYKDMGLRLMFAGNTQGDVYLSCIGADNGSYVTVNRSMATTSYFGNNTVTLIKNKTEIDSSVRDTIVSDLTAAGYCDGDQCVRCKNVTVTLGVDVGSTLDMKWTAEFENLSDAQSAQMVVYTNGEKEVLESTGTGALRTFSYSDIAPQDMAKEITAELWVNGVKVKRETDSVKSYCEKAMEKADEKTKTFIADMLSYGQAFADYKNTGDEIVKNTDTWIKENASEFSQIEANLQIHKKVEQYSDPNNRITSAGLYFYDVNKIYFRANVTEGNKVKINGVEAEYKNGKYYTSGIKATEFDSTYVVTVETAEGNALHRVYYSVNDYVLVKCDSTDTIGTLARALGCYGNSASKLKK